jgi:hypothetical protein
MGDIRHLFTCSKHKQTSYSWMIEEKNANGHLSKQSLSRRSGADKSHCPTPGASGFSNRASEYLVGTCLWASDFFINITRYVLKTNFRMNLELIKVKCVIEWHCGAVVSRFRNTMTSNWLTFKISKSSKPSVWNLSQKTCYT